MYKDSPSTTSAKGLILCVNPLYQSSHRALPCGILQQVNRDFFKNLFRWIAAQKTADGTSATDRCRFGCPATLALAATTAARHRR